MEEQLVKVQAVEEEAAPAPDTVVPAIEGEKKAATFAATHVQQQSSKNFSKLPACSSRSR